MSQSSLVKICGVTTPEDAAARRRRRRRRHRRQLLAAVEALRRRRAPRARCSPPCPQGVLKVGVFVNAPAAEVATRLRALGLDRAQLHGDETPGRLRGARRRRAHPRRARARRGLVRGGRGLDRAAVPVRRARRRLRRRGRHGAVARSSPRLGRTARSCSPGGLTPDNVAAAIAAVRPEASTSPAASRARPVRRTRRACAPSSPRRAPRPARRI